MRSRWRGALGFAIGFALGFLVDDAVKYMGETDGPASPPVAAPEAAVSPEVEQAAVEEPGPPPPAPPTERPEARVPTDVDTLLPIAVRALARLTHAVGRPASTNERILRDIEEVASAYRLLKAFDLRETHNGSMVDETRERRLAKFWKDAEKQLLKAFKLERIEEREPPYWRDDPVPFNVREPVNVAAAEALAATRSDRVSDELIKALERDVFKRRVDASPALLEAGFAALARLGDVGSLEWMSDNFTHTVSSPRAQVDRLVAAHRALLDFDPARVPGKLRHELAYEMLKTYTAVESLANQGSEPHAVDLWNRIGCGVIAAMQQFTGHPKDGGGRGIHTMEGFRVWFREHKNPKREPWLDASTSKR